jgi:hypothetical protein
MDKHLAWGIEAKLCDNQASLSIYALALYSHSNSFPEVSERINCRILARLQTVMKSPLERVTIVVESHLPTPVFAVSIWQLLGPPTCPGPRKYLIGFLTMMMISIWGELDNNGFQKAVCRYIEH